MEALPRTADALAGRSEAVDRVVALEAERERHWPGQEPGRRAAVRVVTAGATFDPDWRVLVGEGPALVGVAAHAGQIVSERGRHHAGGMRWRPGNHRRSVGIVAIGAFHRALVDAVLEGHLEAGPDVLVAAVAQIPLPRGKQRPGFVRIVDRVAAGATNLAGRVRRSAYVHLAKVTGVAGQASLLRLAGSERRKAHDLFLVGRDHVLKSRPVAALAAGSFRRLVARRDRIEVGVATEGIRYGGMAALADLAAHELLLGGCLILGPCRAGPSRGQQANQCARRQPSHAGRLRGRTHAGRSRTYHGPDAGILSLRVPGSPSAVGKQLCYDVFKPSRDWKK